MTNDELLDHSPLTFGKFAGKTPNEIAETTEGAKWLIWASENVKDKKVCSDILVKACIEDQ